MERKNGEADVGNFFVWEVDLVSYNREITDGKFLYLKLQSKSLKREKGKEKNTL
jgi:hypothetical protein